MSFSRDWKALLPLWKTMINTLCRCGHSRRRRNCAASLAWTQVSEKLWPRRATRLCVLALRAAAASRANDVENGRALLLDKTAGTAVAEGALEHHLAGPRVAPLTTHLSRDCDPIRRPAPSCIPSFPSAHPLSRTTHLLPAGTLKHVSVHRGDKNAKLSFARCIRP
jgi:hypothetical protein